MKKYFYLLSLLVVLATVCTSCIKDDDDEVKLNENVDTFEIDESFICENCGKEVKPLGYSCRNHCPYCLYSKHVDINPGDRAEECHGLLEPLGIEMSSKKGYVIVYKCKKCGNYELCTFG